MLFTNKADKKGYIISVVLLSILGVIWVLPLLFMASLSLQLNDRLAVNLLGPLFGYIPYPFTIDNFIRTTRYDEVPRWFFNSLIVSTISTLLVLMISSLAGYAFARLKFYGNKLLYGFTLAGIMIPGEAVFIALYTLFADLGLHNTYISLIVPNLAAPIGTILMTQFFKSISIEIEEAAQIDGANRFEIYRFIMVPISIPAMTTLAIITFLWTWNSYLWPLVTTQEIDMFTITVGLASTQESYAEDVIGNLMSQGIISCIPVIAIFLIFQKYLLKGVVIQTK